MFRVGGGYKVFLPVAGALTTAASVTQRYRSLASEAFVTVPLASPGSLGSFYVESQYSADGITWSGLALQTSTNTYPGASGTATPTPVVGYNVLGKVFVRTRVSNGTLVGPWKESVVRSPEYWNPANNPPLLSTGGPSFSTSDGLAGRYLTFSFTFGTTLQNFAAAGYATPFLEVESTATLVSTGLTTRRVHRAAIPLNATSAGGGMFVFSRANGNSPPFTPTSPANAGPWNLTVRARTGVIPFNFTTESTNGANENPPTFDDSNAKFSAWETLHSATGLYHNTGLP